jgi:hypothetical protein
LGACELAKFCPHNGFVHFNEKPTRTKPLARRTLRVKNSAIGL